MPWTDDPVADYDRHDAEQTRELEKRPRCSECKQHIQGEECWEFNGELICEECLEDNHRKWVDDFLE
jgi:formylmethanofuran dehydrogenase subunit E